MAEIDILIRPESPADKHTVYEVNAAAFGRADEARLVDTLRPVDTTLLSLVADTEGRVVGHALFTKVAMQSENGRACPGAALGPVAVHPSQQRQGIGSALIRAGLEHLRQAGLAYCVVLGHSSYYPRFGFETSTAHGIRCQWDVPEEVFMVLPLRPGGLEGCSGVVQYAAAFEEV